MTLIVKSRALVNQDTGLGTSRGTVRILDPATKHVKAHGKFQAVVTEGGVLNGFLTGHVRARGEDPPRRDGRLSANFRAQVTEQGAVTGELGGGASQNTAVIQSGKCGAPAEAREGEGEAEAQEGQAEADALETVARQAGAALPGLAGRSR